MRFNIPRFRIIDIAKGSAHQPLASTDFLADTTIDILHEIVAVILTLSERHLQHEFPLRSWLKPKCRKTQKSNLFGINEIDDAPTVHAVSREAVRMPCNYSICLASFNARHHLAEQFSSGLFCAFRLLKFLKNFKIFFTRIFSQLKKLCLNGHYLVVIVLR